MNNVDMLVLTTMSLVNVLCVLYLYLVPGYSRFMSIVLFIIYTLPLIGFSIIITYVVLKKIPFLQRVKLSCCKFSTNSQKTAVDQEANNIEANLELPHRINCGDGYSETYLD